MLLTDKQRTNWKVLKVPCSTMNNEQNIENPMAVKVKTVQGAV